MNKLQENKDLVVRYFNAISGVIKTDEICDTYMTDQKLKEHILFFDTIFPKYELFADEMTAEADRLSVRARMVGVHEGDFNGIPPTQKRIDMPFVISYTIKNGIITDHWMIADQMSMMEQLGLMGKESAAGH